MFFKFVFELSAPEHEHALELFESDSVQELPGLREESPSSFSATIRFSCPSCSAV